MQLYNIYYYSQCNFWLHIAWSIVVGNPARFRGTRQQFFTPFHQELRAIRSMDYRNAVNSSLLSAFYLSQYKRMFKLQFLLPQPWSFILFFYYCRVPSSVTAQILQLALKGNVINCFIRHTRCRWVSDSAWTVTSGNFYTAYKIVFTFQRNALSSNRGFEIR